MSFNKFFIGIISKPFIPENFRINQDVILSDDEIFSLKILLLENLIENILTIALNNKLELSILLTEPELNFFEGKLLNQLTDKINIQLFSNSEKFLDNIKISTKFFLILSDTMGLSSEELTDTTNLILSDENVLVISKSENNEINYIASNHFDYTLIRILLENNISYDEFLSKIKPDLFFIHTKGGNFRVNSFTNFKLLYKKLSSKESMLYCSNNMHEKFTNHFIEYRDYLK